jgi:hypothetical protein
MTKFRKEGLAAELRSFSRLTVRLEYAGTIIELAHDENIGSFNIRAGC